MLETLFTIIIAGCGESAASCTVLERTELRAATMEVCEAELDARMAALPAGWPEYAGLCSVTGGSEAVALGWAGQEVQIAKAD